MKKSNAFSVTYMVTSALTGNALELLGTADIIRAITKGIFSRSSVEMRIITRLIYLEDPEPFWFGGESAWMFLHLFVVCSLSTAFPIITLVGIVYFVIKHLVDMYNLGSVAKPTKINKGFHLSIISFVVGSSVSLQFYNLLYIALNSSRLNNTSKLVGFVAIFSSLFHLIQMTSEWKWPFEIMPKHSGSRKSNDEMYWPPFHSHKPKPFCELPRLQED